LYRVEVNYDLLIMLLLNFMFCWPWISI